MILKAIILTGGFLAICTLAVIAIVLYETVRDTASEDTRMELMRRQLDELWQDEEDPLAERAAEQRLREWAERCGWFAETAREIDALPIANRWDVAQ